MTKEKRSSVCPFCEQRIVEGLPGEMTCPRCNIKYERKLRGVFIGRFQPFHNGHLEVIKKALEEVDEIAIVIGSTQKFYARDDPFTADEREQMIQAALEQEGISAFRIYQAADIPDDDKYVAHIKGIVPRFDVVYAATNKLNKELFSDAGYPVRVCQRHLGVEATNVRRAMIDGKDWESMVPDAAAAYLKKIKGDARVRALANEE